MQVPAPNKWKNSDKQSHNIDNRGQNVALNKIEEWNWEDTNMRYWHKTNTNRQNQQIQQCCKSQRPKSGKTVINRAITLSILDKMLDRTNQKNEIGRIQIWNSGTKQIQVNRINKSNCTAILLKGGQMGGGESGGSSEIFCDEICFPVGLNLVSTHRRIQIYPIFGSQ